MFCQHPWGQRRALSELTWAVVFQPFSPCSSPPCYFSFCHPLPSIWQIPLPPPPRPIEMASLLHTNASLCALGIPHAASYLWLGYVRPPCGVIAALLIFASCPDVALIIRWNPGLPTRVATTWSEHLRSGSRNAAAAFWLHWYRRKEKNRAWGARRSSFERLTAKSGKEILRRVEEAAKFSTLHKTR